MSKSRPESIGLIPIQQAEGCQTFEFPQEFDKPGSKMITNIKKALIPAFPHVIIGREVISWQTTRFIDIKLEPKDESDKPKSRKKAQGRSVWVTLKTTPKGVELSSELPVTVVTGMCLFGASSLIAVTTEGRKFSLVNPFELQSLVATKSQIAEIIEVSNLHPAELQDVLRFTETMKILIGQGSKKPIKKIFFHLPIPEYKLYMLGLYKQGIITREQFNWLQELIKKRAQKLFALVRKRVDPNVEIQAGSPLDVIEEFFSLPVDQVNLESLIEKLQKSNPLFEKAIQAMQSIEFYTDLNKLSYVVAYLNAWSKVGNPPQQILAVESYEEQTILNNVVEIGTKIGVQPSIVALYVLPFTVVDRKLPNISRAEGRGRLFMYDPHTDAPPNTDPHTDAPPNTNSHSNRFRDLRTVLGHFLRGKKQV